MSYDNGDDSTNWIIDSGSTHHMNGFASEFLNMPLKGYDDGLLGKGPASGIKAYSIGSCIDVVNLTINLITLMVVILVYYWIQILLTM